ncbi:MAG: glycosyltransferase family 39 protein [Blautia sp.]|nr:glycosyltransferase family 39 protein [Blautia sp.]
MTESRKKKITAIVLWGGLLAAFGVTRLLYLMELPAGYHIDEAGMAYDAWCLAQYGVDRYLKSWPVYLINFGGGQNALYTFLCAFLFKIFGWNPFLIRVPAVLFSLLTLIFGVKIACEIYSKDSYLPYAAGALIVICPCFILSGRFGLESYLMLGMSTVFLYFFLKALENGKYVNYILAGITGGLVLYTYALTYIILPLFLLLSLFYCIRVRKLEWKKWFVMAVPLAILAAPLIAVQIVNMFDLPEMTWGIFTITKLEVYRASEIGRFRWDYFVKAWNSIFNGDHLIYNSIPGIPNLYGKTPMLFILGLVCIVAKTVISVKDRKWLPSCLVLFWFLSVFGLCAHIDSNVNRINGIFCSVILIAIEGIWVLWQARGWIARGICCLWVLIYAWGFLRFGQYYYSGAYALDNPDMMYFDVTVEEGTDYIEAHPQLGERVTYMAEQGIYHALGSRISPYELRIGERKDNRYGNYVWGQLGLIYEDCNYIVRHTFTEYMEELRQMGFQEIDFGDYSLFFME